MEIKPRKLISDLLILILSIVIYIYTSYIMSPFIRGFYCDDESIRLPYIPQIITYTPWQIIVFFTGIVVVIFTEYFIGVSKSVSNISGLLPEWIILSYKNSFDYVMGILFLGILTSIMQSYAGVLRPTFLVTCNPNVDLTNCEQYNHTYITDYVCQNELDKLVLEDSRRSFPSIHAAHSLYIIVFCVYYIQVKWEINKCEVKRIWKYIIQGVITILFLWILTSRYMGNRYHIMDLTVGGIIGAICGWFMVACVMKVEDQINNVNLDPEIIPLIA